jgi:hypothetical protein
MDNRATPLALSPNNIANQERFVKKKIAPTGIPHDRGDSYKRNKNLFNTSVFFSRYSQPTKKSLNKAARAIYS